MGNGVDLHSFQPSVEDVAKIADADLFIYVGGESDQWPSDAVRAADNPNLHSLSLLEAVGDAAVEEEVVEGMKAVEAIQKIKTNAQEVPLKEVRIVKAYVVE
jgi:zinc transport system substrate-binding protein